jgi:uncharacterized protein (TIGR02646 family)
MKHIKKNKEPKSLLSYRSSNDPNKKYDNYRDKDGLGKSLLEEQGNICCYCMQRIPDKKGRFKIEHWEPQSLCPERQLIYENLLASCLGGEGGPKHMQHCDTSKADRKITINPTDPRCESLITFTRKSKSENLDFKRAATYSLSGEITSDDPKIKKELNEILNLNLQTIVENRRAAFEVFMVFFRKNNPGTWNRQIIEKEIEKWSAPSNKPYKPYCQIVVYYLKTKLMRLSKAP